MTFGAYPPFTDYVLRQKTDTDRKTDSPDLDRHVIHNACSWRWLSPDADIRCSCGVRQVAGVGIRRQGPIPLQGRHHADRLHDLAGGWRRGIFRVCSGSRTLEPWPATICIGPPASEGACEKLNPTLIASRQRNYRDTLISPAVPIFYKLPWSRRTFKESEFSNVASAASVDTVAPVIVHAPVAAAAPGNSVRIAGSDNGQHPGNRRCAFITGRRAVQLTSWR